MTSDDPTVDLVVQRIVAAFRRVKVILFGSRARGTAGRTSDVDLLFAVQEARERVRAAVRNTNYELPSRKITVNLAPADARKEGPAFDLPMAVGILAATEQIRPAALDGTLLLGELSLDGTLRPVAGVLCVALAPGSMGARALVVPQANAAEASLVQGLTLYPAGSLADVIRHLEGTCELTPVRGGLPEVVEPPPADEDFGDVRGQVHARRALEIAAAGGHNLVLVGPPGAGKTMLARRLPTILPLLSAQEALEITRIYSVAGLLPPGGLVRRRPFRNPHHTTSAAALTGGGPVPRPGEVTLAHRGVLFLDELPEFHREALEALRQPLEDGVVTVARVQSTVTFPARLTLVGAMNPLSVRAPGRCVAGVPVQSCPGGAVPGAGVRAAAGPHRPARGGAPGERRRAARCSCALEQGREVFAVPGPVTSATTALPHRLVQQGAKLVKGVEDVLEELRVPVRPPPPPPAVALEGPEATVYGVLTLEPRSLDALVRRCGLPVATVGRALAKVGIGAARWDVRPTAGAV